MFCLRDFDMAAAFNKPNLFRLYAETPYSIKNGVTLEKHVQSHVEHSNYGHRGNEESAKFYGWQDLSDVIVIKDRFEHEMLHAFLDILCEEEGWSPFLADGNLFAEALVHMTEIRFNFWYGRYNTLIKTFGENEYSALVEGYCEEDRLASLLTLKKALTAASESERPMTAFEARFLGVMPTSKDYEKMQIGDVNKWGEALPDLEFKTEQAKLFFRRMELIRKRMFKALDSTSFGTDNKSVCQAFFRTLRMDEVAEMISGRNPHQELSFDYKRVKNVWTQTYNVAGMKQPNFPSPPA